jgi:hypothetical protein
MTHRAVAKMHHAAVVNHKVPFKTFIPMFELIVKFEDAAERGTVLTYDDYGNAAEAALVYREMGAIVTVNEI